MLRKNFVGSFFNFREDLTGSDAQQVSGFHYCNHKGFEKVEMKPNQEVLSENWHQNCFCVNIVIINIRKLLKKKN